MEVDGVSLTMGGAAVSAIAGVVGAWVKAKYGKTTVPQKRAEERAQATHRRLDPFIQEIGAVRGKIEIIEKAATNATIGGKK